MTTTQPNTRTPTTSIVKTKSNNTLGGEVNSDLKKTGAYSDQRKITIIRTGHFVRPFPRRVELKVASNEARSVIKIAAGGNANTGNPLPDCGPNLGILRSRSAFQ